MQQVSTSGELNASEGGTLNIAEKYAPPSARLSDLGGIDHCIEEVLQLIGMPLRHPEIYLHLGIAPPRGVLLHGPPGCGKTMLAHAIAGEAGVPFISISAPSVVSGMSGESEKKIREVFEEAKQHAPCILFIDEIDAITPKRETAQREMERRIVAQLLTCLDDVSPDETDFKPVLVIGATNRPDSLDPALRRAGRFDREISMGVPDEAARKRILEKMCAKLRLSGDFDFQQLAKLTPGFVGADLQALTSEAGMVCVRRIFGSLMSNTAATTTATQDTNQMNGETSATGTNPDEMNVDDTPAASEKPPAQATEALDLKALISQNPNVITSFLFSRPDPLSPADLSSLAITNDDFLRALTKVQPSSKREGFATSPDVTWSDVGALSAIRDELRMSVVEPIRNPDIFRRVGIVRPVGVLLYGPPGCGKTMLAKAVASESCCNFISVRGPELLNKYVGESERGIRQVFARAISSSPCVIFFDEIDAICPARSSDAENQSTSRLVNTLLTEMDGMGTRSQVYVIAATNRPDLIDPAMLRPGRLDKALYVDLPTAPERLEILRTLTTRNKIPLASDVDLPAVAADARADGLSGADLAALVREAGVAALRRSLAGFDAASRALEDPDARMGKRLPDATPSTASAGHAAAAADEEPLCVAARDFATAFRRLAPSVSKKDRKRYELLRVKFSAGSAAAAGTGSANADADVTVGAGGSGGEAKSSSGEDGAQFLRE
ncbi:P-loop containing nucleoside triphosphate hydrolase protein [Zopfochytrium polystomum]|nr:P-loop containing nucleoside triphosphate hydrolase protein [Zopfochytrium polystomum]